jgi:hypothetical protein
MITEDVIVGIAFACCALLSSLLFLPRFQHYARWGGGGASMSLISRLFVCLFFLSCSVLALCSVEGPWIGVPLAVFLFMYLSLIADRKHHYSLKHDP